MIVNGVIISNDKNKNMLNKKIIKASGLSTIKKADGLSNVKKANGVKSVRGSGQKFYHDLKNIIYNK